MSLGTLRSSGGGGLQRELGLAIVERDKAPQLCARHIHLPSFPIVQAAEDARACDEVYIELPTHTRVSRYRHIPCCGHWVGLAL